MVKRNLRLVMKDSPKSNPHQETRSLLLRFNAVAIGLPLFALCLVVSYIFLFDVELESRDWNRIVFVLWIGALFGLGYSFLRLLLGNKREIERPSSVRKSGPFPRKSVADWEMRSARKIVEDFVAYLALVPVLALGLVWLADKLIPLEMRHSDWKNAVMCVWLGVLFALVIPTRRAISSKMGRR